MKLRTIIVLAVILGWITGTTISNIVDGPHTISNYYASHWEQLNETDR